MGIFDLQRDPKISILILSSMAKNCMKTVFRNKKSHQKPFFMIWGEKKFFEKKVKFSPKKAKKTRYAEISMADFFCHCWFSVKKFFFSATNILLFPLNFLYGQNSKIDEMVTQFWEGAKLQV